MNLAEEGALRTLGGAARVTSESRVLRHERVEL